MKRLKIKRFIVTAILLLTCYLFQCTLFDRLAPVSVKPNLLLIFTAAVGFLRGPWEGMLAGFFSGLLIDVQYGNILGFYALLYLLPGYVNGLFQQVYYDEDLRLPLGLTALSELFYGMAVYFLMFMLRSEFDFLYYVSHIIIPELIYTIVVTLGLYPLILFINNKLDAEEKRSAARIV